MKPAYLSKKEYVSLAFFFLVYLILTQVSRWVFFSLGTAPIVVLAPAGVALAGLIIYGYKFWPAIAIATVLSGLISGADVPYLLIATAGNVLQALIGYFVLNKIFK